MQAKAKRRSKGLDDGVRGRQGDTALIDAFNKSNITRFSPRRSPRVLDNVVVQASLGAVADSQNTMVQVGTARSSEDTRGIELEGGLVSLDGDGDGADSADGGQQVGLGAGLDVLVRGQSGGLGAGLGARLLDALVRVSGLLADAVLDDPLESVVHQTTVAAHVARRAGAVDQLLLRQRDQVLGGDGVSTLDGTGGGESPAAAALALVLDRGDGTSLAPVDGIGGLDALERGEVLGARERVLHVVELQELGLELFLGQVSKLVDGHSVGIVVLVVLGDEVQVLLEDIVASEEALVLVGLVVLGDEPGKSGLVFAFGQGLDAGDSGEKGGSDSSTTYCTAILFYMTIILGLQTSPDDCWKRRYQEGRAKAAYAARAHTP